MVDKQDNIYQVIQPIFTPDEVFDRRFRALKEELEQHYFWCKVKLNLYAAILLVLLLILK